MRILITGASGQLGRALRQALRDHEVVAQGHESLDITNRAAVAGIIHEIRPDAVINAAAWTDTAGCERDPQRARLTNGEGAGSIAAASRKIGALLVQVSSNEVFDGTKAPYREDDIVNPVNEYGRSKLLGEQAVMGETDRCQIVRTSWLYGPGRVSFPEKIVERATVDGRLRLVTDEIACPTWTVDLAAAMSRLIETGQTGIFHLCNEGVCSRKEWGEVVLRLAGLDVPVEGATQAEFGLPYVKPVNSALKNTRAAGLGITLRPWQEALAEHLGTTSSKSHEAARA